MKKEIILDCIRKNRNTFLLFAFSTAVNLSVFRLYRMMTEAFWYAEILILVFCLVLFIGDLICEVRKVRLLDRARASVTYDRHTLPVAESLAEKEYQEMIRTLGKEIERLNSSFSEERQDMQDYYTVWVHQIKTPIAVMKLKLTENDSELSLELFRIEEYVDMALAYIRLGSEQNDLVIREYALDDMIRDMIRKYAPQFIAKKLRLDYSPTAQKVVTDKKWFVCMLEQLISNAVKYTKSGAVTISVNENELTVADTGIGIAPEDLPRIFEKGYTGLNGRTGAKSSGLGLYLCKKAANLINVQIYAESQVGKGSRFTVVFPETESDFKVF